MLTLFKKIFYEVTGSVTPISERLGDSIFTAFEPPAPNAHVNSESYLEDLELMIPPVMGRFEFIKRKASETITVDITDIAALGAGKGLDAFPTELSSGLVYKDMDAFAKDGSKNELDAGIKAHGISPESVEYLLTHDQVRIVKEQTSDSLLKTAWSGRISLENAGGAHHFAAARYIAKEIGYKRPITGKLYEMYVDISQVRQFMLNNVMLIVSKKDIPMDWDEGSINVMIEKKCRDKRDGRALYFPENRCEEPFLNYVVMFFVKTPQTGKVCELLKAHGAFDVGEYLLQLS